MSKFIDEYKYWNEFSKGHGTGLSGTELANVLEKNWKGITFLDKIVIGN